jgi:hypothetical protein
MRKHVRYLTGLIVLFLMVSVQPLWAQMGGGMNSGGSGSMMGMTNGGGFGMMNGMAGSPVVADDGTVYLVGYEPNPNPGSVPNSNSFTSKLIAITPGTGQIVSLTLNGIVSRPVVSGNILVATASLPSFNNFMMFGNYGVSGPDQECVVYGIQLPLTATTVPTAFALDGGFASVPVIANNQIYVTTTAHGDVMMGQDMFAGMFGSFDFNNQVSNRSYLYVIGFDGSLKAKIVIE